jgi:hypothetical protein
VGGLARGGRVVVMSYAAGTETTMRVTDLVPGYPAGYPPAGHDYQPWRMRIKPHAT